MRKARYHRKRIATKSAGMHTKAGLTKTDTLARLMIWPSRRLEYEVSTLGRQHPESQRLDSDGDRAGPPFGSEGRKFLLDIFLGASFKGG
jgi:hypothetical protein